VPINATTHKLSVLYALAYGKSYIGVKARPPSFDFWAE
jgi:hypothetical protein